MLILSVSLSYIFMKISINSPFPPDDMLNSALFNLNWKPDQSEMNATIGTKKPQK